ncbi:hypothetical protein [Kitasatospora sp. NPDC088548]|uniref:hypothetical protein n=1 Tax=Kitasatospora sp. NPDC088548 TaxID=3364075 RepID=UPI00381F3072
MNLRPWVAASLAGAVVALASPSAGVAAQASARHASGSPWLQDRDGDEDRDGDHHHHNPWRDCHSSRRVVLIDQNFRAILVNGRYGPEAIVIQGDSSSSSSSPAAPWNSFTVSTYLNVDYPTQSSNQYQWKIRDFFREHPLFVVRAFGRHERAFPFPATHCTNGQDDGDRGDRAFPDGGEAADGRGASGSPSPLGGDNPQNGRPEPETPGSGGTVRPLPRDTAASGRSDRLLSAKHIGIAAGGLLMVLGMLATARLRRRRSAARSSTGRGTDSTFGP